MGSKQNVLYFPWESTGIQNIPCTHRITLCWLRKNGVFSILIIINIWYTRLMSIKTNRSIKSLSDKIEGVISIDMLICLIKGEEKIPSQNHNFKSRFNNNIVSLQAVNLSNIRLIKLEIFCQFLVFFVSSIYVLFEFRFH